MKRNLIARGLLWLACLATPTVSQAQMTEVVLHRFKGGADGYSPLAGVIGDALGNLYGTTVYGGTFDHGVVYKVDGAGHETVLYNFEGAGDGGYPSAGVILDLESNLYGTTYEAWAGARSGVVYKLDSSGNQTVLYTFMNGPDGGYPTAGVIRDAAGNLYGTTSNGGASGYGVVYQVDTAGNETVLHNFMGGADGASPYAGLIRDAASNLYGTAVYGGASNAGVVYKVDTAGNETVLYSFSGELDGGYPYAGVMRDEAGNLFGTTFRGGASGAGVVYRVDSAGHEGVLYSFSGGADGGYPYAGVTSDPAGNLYGSTLSGGAWNSGVVYKVDRSGNETVLYSFAGGAEGAGNYDGVIHDKAGNLFGTGYIGGGGNGGVVFKLMP